jgi:hypothetical protein
MVMSKTSPVQQRTSPSPSPVRSRISVLRQAFAAHTLKRAIAAVASTSGSDLRDFGIDKGELLEGLARLRDVAHWAPDAGSGLSVTVVRRQVAPA